jgi:hypothetical protein
MIAPMSRRTLLPALAAIGALIVAAWFYLGTRQTADLASANAIVNSADQHLSKPQADRALSLLHSAAFLNPDRTIDLDRSRIAVKTGHKRRAYRLAISVTDAEPMNAVAWQYVAQAALNSREVDAAFARFAALVAPAAR